MLYIAVEKPTTSLACMRMETETDFKRSGDVLTKAWVHLLLANEVIASGKQVRQDFEALTIPVAGNK